MQTQHPLSTVTPTLDGDVLLTLATAPGVTFTTGQIEKMLRLSGGTRGSVTGIRKVLTRLVSEGTVDHERVGGVGAYRFNNEHLAASAIRDLARLRSMLLERLEETVQSWDVPPVYGAVFGSAARGHMRPDSDIDLFLVRPAGADSVIWDEQVARLSAQVRRWTGNSAEVLLLDEAEVVAHPGDPVLREIVEDGLPFAGRSAWLRRVVTTADL